VCQNRSKQGDSGCFDIGKSSNSPFKIPIVFWVIRVERLCHAPGKKKFSPIQTPMLGFGKSVWVKPDCLARQRVCMRVAE
jgi:hypothetical protein